MKILLPYLTYETLIELAYSLDQILSKDVAKPIKDEATDLRFRVHAELQNRKSKTL